MIEQLVSNEGQALVAEIKSKGRIDLTPIPLTLTTAEEMLTFCQQVVSVPMGGQAGDLRATEENLEQLLRLEVSAGQTMFRCQVGIGANLTVLEEDHFATARKPNVTKFHKSLMQRNIFKKDLRTYYRYKELFQLVKKIPVLLGWQLSQNFVKSNSVTLLEVVAKDQVLLRQLE